jgi:hypothetical protein
MPQVHSRSASGNGGKEALDGPRELAERYWSELCELLDGGEISGALARRIAADMFEPPQPGRAPEIKWSVWCRYVEDQQKLSEIYALRRFRPA